MADEPPISDQEAIDLVRRLYRKFMGAECPAPVKITTGNRLTWRPVLGQSQRAQERQPTGGGFVASSSTRVGSPRSCAWT